MTADIMKEFLKICIQKELKKRGCSHAELARALGFVPSYINDALGYRFERTSIEVLIDFAEALELDVKMTATRLKN